MFDAGYGHLPWLLRALEGEGETFLAEVYSDQTIYLKRPDPKDKSIVPLELDKGRGVSPIGGPVELSMDPVSGRLTEGQP